MRKMYRVALCSSVASAAFMLTAPAALAQTVVNQTATNSSTVSNPPLSGTNTIDMGGGGLGVGASVSTSAGGAVVSTSVTGINSQFVNPTGGFGAVTQSAVNNPGANVSNSGAITNAGGTADSGSSLSISARGAGASFSIIAVGGIPFQPVANVGDIAQGFVVLVASPPVVNGGNIINSGEITGPSGGPALDLSGMGASASVSAGGAQSSVSLSVMGATTFTGTTFGAINQAPNNTSAASGGVFNNLTTGGISLGAISGDGASASASATGAAASVSLSYINTTNWSPTQIGFIFQNPQNSAVNVSNNHGTITVGAVSGDGASVRTTAAGAFAGVSYSTIGSTAAVGGTGQTIGNVGQLVTSSGNVYSDGVFVGTGLSGAGSAVVASAVGAGASFSASSIGDTSTAALTTTGGVQSIPITQQVTNTGTDITNFGQINFGAISGNGAAASMSATGAQASVGISAINTTAYTTPLTGVIFQAVTNGTVATPSEVNNVSTGVTVGNLSGHGSSVSLGATGAAASIGVSFINTTAWTSFPLSGVTQSATNNGAVNNMPNVNTISVGSLSGTGASVRASATGAVASVSVSSILSGPPATNVFGSAGMQQTAINTGAISNRASIVSTGTLSGMASSASISATGAATSVAVASIADTVVMPPPTATIQNITQTSTNNLASPITNTGSITLAGGNLGVGAMASISAVGASASVSFLAVK
jgi:fibronectin-binding autotransporter adhesin